jgi:membrane-associated phospholipid phosphatase
LADVRSRWQAGLLAAVVVTVVAQTASALPSPGALAQTVPPAPGGIPPASTGASAGLTQVPAQVPLAANFSRLELVTSGFVAVAGGALMLFGTDLFGAPATSMGPPQPDSFDARWTRKLALSGKGAFMGGTTDVGGIYVLPVLPAIFYGLETYGFFERGRPFVRTGDRHPHHRLAAYVEAIGFTMLVTGGVKAIVGRARPYTADAFDRPERRHAVDEDNLSFFSGHSSISFATGAFVTADVSRGLLRGPLADASTGSRVVLGYMLPALVGYGLPTLVAVSRVADLQHWPSDAIVGALVGGLIGHLAYTRHFDGSGDPLVRLVGSVTPIMVSQPATKAGGKSMTGLGLAARF